MGGVYRYRASNRAFRQKRKIVSEKFHVTRNIKRHGVLCTGTQPYRGLRYIRILWGSLLYLGGLHLYTASNRAFRKKKIGSDKLQLYMNRNIKRTLVFSAPIHSDIEGVCTCAKIYQSYEVHIYIYIYRGPYRYTAISAHSYMYFGCFALVHSYVEVHSQEQSPQKIKIGSDRLQQYMNRNIKRISGFSAPIHSHIWVICTSTKIYQSYAVHSYICSYILGWFVSVHSYIGCFAPVHTAMLWWSATVHTATIAAHLLRKHRQRKA